MKRTMSRLLAAMLLVSVLLPALMQYPEAALAADADKLNLAINKKVTQSSDCSCGRAATAVDGNEATFWQPLSADRSDGTVWMTVDLGSTQLIDETVLNFRTGDISSYTIQTSTDQADWRGAVVKNVTDTIAGKVETVNFPAVNARYVRLTVSLANTNFQLNEFGIYNSNVEAPPAGLDSVYVTDVSGRTMGAYDTVSLGKGETYPLKLGGEMSDGTMADLSKAQVAWESTSVESVTINSYGNVSAVQEGVAKITGRATLNNVTKEVSVWVDVYDSSILLVDVQMDHPTMVHEIGKPALLHVGDPLPSIRLMPYSDGRVKGALISSASGEILTTFQPDTLRKGVEQVYSFPGIVPVTGQYEVRMEFEFDGNKPVYDSLYITIQDPLDVGATESKIAYQDKQGKMVYAPDYRGNKIIDFSNAGYMGGGIKIPDVETRIAVDPGEGDDTARIQAAIDQVSKLPESAEGFRGAVLLKKGRHEVAGTLYIRASGVVLRGEGQGEDGTVVYAAGTTKRNILEIQGEAPKLLEDSTVKVADLYIPAGANSLHVDDSRGYNVGDQVKVRRYGNARWIHEIDMDTIFERSGTTQWTPFNLDFDRVITQIDGNMITFDAPLPNSIERRWGGGEVIKYEDPGRIQQVGVENLRVDSQFDPSVTAVNAGKTYYSDENHAVSFAVFTNVKNAWLREVTGLHLNHALAHVSRGSKWITVQDNKSLDMVSVITGERRYPYKISGELTLMQRNYAETARHAFIVDSRVQGPNVFLQSESVNEFATSEPHHRWSVGGLYDNVKADIAIQDRGQLGSGHGWTAANYVTWNTEGDLVSQQPPTAQNYAIGHVGNKVKPYLPNGDDKRPRSDAYWEHLGIHVDPGSLYLQQLSDRLGAAALQNIERSKVGGGPLDIPQLQDNLPLLKGIKIDNKELEGFSPDVFDYTVQLSSGGIKVPQIRPHDSRYDVTVLSASTIYGRTVLIVRDKKDPMKSVRYNLRFNTP